MPCGKGAADPWWWRGGAHMSALKDLLARLSEQRGQTMAEYAVVLAVITVVIIASLQALSGGIGAALDSVTGTLPCLRAGRPRGRRRRDAPEPANGRDPG